MNKSLSINTLLFHELSIHIHNRVTMQTSLIPLRPFSSMCVVGPTGSGKTRMVFRMLKNLRGVFDHPPPDKILYCYGVWQNLFEEMESTIDNIVFHEGVPNHDEINEFAHNSQHRMIILDDLMSQVLQNSDMELLFTQGTHHKKLSCVFLSQNLYQQGRYSRSITLNTWYLVLFRNAREASQIHTLARQIFPRNSKKLLNAYIDHVDATQQSFGYSVIDFSPNVEDDFRLRTHIFPDEDCIIYT